MALEVEYVDMDTFENVVAPDADPVSMINGDGSEAVAESVSDQPGVGDLSQSDEFDGEAKEAEADASEPENVSQEGEQAQPIGDAELARQRKVAEDLHWIEIAKTKEEHFSLAVKRAELESELKDIKADEKAALKNLRNLIKRGPNYPQAKSKIDEAVETGGEKSAIQVDDPEADNSWRSVPTSQIIEGIKGMGGKKAEAIVSLAPTLGDLEELRAKASMVCKPFGSVLPRGIGGNMADEIENRIDAYWTERRKHEAAAAVATVEVSQGEDTDTPDSTS